MGENREMDGNPNEPVHDDEGYEILRKKVFDERGLDTFQYKDKFLTRRFKARMRSRGVVTYREYIYLLDTDKEEYGKLFDKLTINVTEFFRNPEMWDAFKEKILPIIFARPREKRIVRIWSAGCSSGEEVYTIAMLVDQYLWNKDSKLQVVIRGTDLDNDTLKKARVAQYPAEKVRRVPKLLKRLYFSLEGDEYKVNDKIKKMVRLAKHDLISGRKQKYFDVIFCRNVIIYFTKGQQNSLFRHFHDALTVDGYLILGKTETLMGEVKSHYTIMDSQERIYQKR